MRNVLAAIGRGQLRVLDERVAAKRRIFGTYAQTIGDLPGISFMPEAPWGRCTRWLTVITVDPAQSGATREDIRLALEVENIESRPVWNTEPSPPLLVPLSPYLASRRGSVSQMNKTIDVSSSPAPYPRVCLPPCLCRLSGTAMRAGDQRRVVEVIRSVGR